jgi:hypothetical protein
VDREQRVRKFTLDNESPRSRTAIILPSTEKSERNSAPRRKPAGKYKINKCEKKPHARQARGKVWEGRSVHDRYHFVALEKIV